MGTEQQDIKRSAFPAQANLPFDGIRKAYTEEIYCGNR